MVASSRYAEHVADTRLAVLDAAEMLFTDPGFANASLDEIAEQAGVTKGAAYHHFDSKHGLFRAVVERLHRRLRDDLAGMENSTSPKGDLWDTVRAAYQARLDRVGVDPAFQRIVDRDAIAVLGPTALREIAESIADTALVPILDEAIDRGLISPLPSGTLARMMGSLIGAAGREIAAADDAARARREVGHTLDAFLQGLRR